MLRLAVASCLLALTASAQPVTISGQVRTRSEVDDRDLAGEQEVRAVHLLRTRVGLDARPARHLRAVVQIQDSRFWGGEDPALALGTLDGSADQLDVHQAFIEADSLFARGLGVRIGRQELAYGNQRLIGSVGWSNVGRSFDAAVVRLHTPSLSADLFAAQLVRPVGGEGGQAIGGLYASWTGAGTYAADVFAIADGDAAKIEAGPDAGQRRRARLTSGLRLHGRAGPIGYTVEGIVQTGAMTGPDSLRRDLQAWLGSASLSAPVGPLALGVGATHLSGDADASDATDRRFDTLFATNHKFYGAMDYFPRQLGSAGLQDVEASVTATPLDRLRLRATGHVFASAVDAGAGRALGRELDLDAAYAVVSGTSLSAGASVFAASDRFASGRTMSWLYAMATVGF